MANGSGYTVIWNGSSAVFPESMSVAAIHNTMIEMYPELANYQPVVDGNRITFVHKPGEKGIR